MGKFPAYTGRNREPGEAGGRSVIFGRGAPSLLPAPGQVLGHRAVPGMGTPDTTRSQVLPVLGRPPQDVTTDVRALLQPLLQGAGEGESPGPRFPAPSWPGAVPTKEGPTAPAHLRFVD